MVVRAAPGSTRCVAARSTHAAAKGGAMVRAWYYNRRVYKRAGCKPAAAGTRAVGPREASHQGWLRPAIQAVAGLASALASSPPRPKGE